MVANCFSWLIKALYYLSSTHCRLRIYTSTPIYTYVIGCLSGPLTADNRITASIYRSHIWKHHEKLNGALVSIASKSNASTSTATAVVVCWCCIEKWGNDTQYLWKEKSTLPSHQSIDLNVFHRWWQQCNIRKRWRNWHGAQTLLTKWKW